MAKTILHVNQHNVKFNRKHGNIKPIFTIKSKQKNRYANKVIIKGPSELIYSYDKPQKCGAHAWLETNSEVELIGEMSYPEVCAFEKKI